MTVGSQAAVPAKPWAQQQLDYERAWRFGTGEGQRVAVIDTGVSKNPRLTVVAGGDYVDKAGDGTTDCDAHGSVVASIIGAKPSAADRTGYAGVAPGAQILSIRQYSAHYRPAAAPVAGRPEVVGYGNVATLASAVDAPPTAARRSSTSRRRPAAWPVSPWRRTPCSGPPCSTPST